MSEHFWPCESLNGAGEIGSHSRARGGCHVSTLFPGRDVTILLVSEHRFVNDLNCFESSGYRYFFYLFICLAIVVRISPWDIK